MKRLLIMFGLVLFNSPLWSFTCFYTLIKDSCWTNYDVSVDVIDASNLNKLFTVSVPKGKNWERVKFSCTAAQSLIYKAHYSPVFWENEKGKTYHSLRNWTLPGKINPGDLAWTIPVCYPKEFAQVPLPPDAKGSCKCDLKSIPEPKV